jgi:hypothetical protein
LPPPRGICGNSPACCNHNATASPEDACIETAGVIPMNKITHSEIASSVLHVVTIAAMVIFSAVSLLRGTGLMG